MKPPRIVLVEDSAADARLVEEALVDAGVDVRLDTIRDGDAALALLAADADQARLLPDLVLLDLNLPGTSGLDVLRQVRADPRLQSVPVIVLSTSAAEGDVSAAYELGANSYVVKPVGFDDFLAAVRTIEAFWLALARRPQAD